jgi:hypothetical protein
MKAHGAMAVGTAGLRLLVRLRWRSVVRRLGLPRGAEPPLAGRFHGHHPRLAGRSPGVGSSPAASFDGRQTLEEVDVLLAGGVERFDRKGRFRAAQPRPSFLRRWSDPDNRSLLQGEPVYAKAVRQIDKAYQVLALVNPLLYGPHG